MKSKAGDSIISLRVSMSIFYTVVIWLAALTRQAIFLEILSLRLLGGDEDALW